MNPLALALAGRREDNAAHGGQVAHISAAEADLLRRMGGAASINPVTGLPEYFGAPPPPPPPPPPPGPFGFNMGNVSAQALGLGLGNAMGVGPAMSSIGSNNAAIAAQQAQQAQQANLGLSNIGQMSAEAPPPPAHAQYGGEAPASTPVNAVMSSTLGVPVTFGEGMGEGASGFVTHGNLSGQVAGTPITEGDVAFAEMANQLGDAVSVLGDLGIPPISPAPPSVLSVPSAMLGFFAQMASAQTAQNVANTRGAMALAGPGMGAPSAAHGGDSGARYNYIGAPTVSYGGYRPPSTSGVSQLLNAAVSEPIPAPIEPEPVVSAAPVSTPVAPVTTLLQTDPREEGFSPAIQEIRRLFFESLA